ncbi:hypothetical protein FN846DRAFT_894991 [Sphaerosporella brunnea]|uniref:Uncharacterized protein n=1 Tax=Sphaerosporella brunnea TaxID=1250544 RepID=A0A5J5EHF9_9PEZI|nr:hypothetical protein FN846DRAFT_894991 [Sphaerosporella brunnea]
MAPRETLRRDAASTVGGTSQSLGNPDHLEPQLPGDVIDELDADLHDRIASGATIIPSFSELHGFIELWRRGSDTLAAIAPTGRITVSRNPDNRRGMQGLFAGPNQVVKGSRLHVVLTQLVSLGFAGINSRKRGPVVAARSEPAQVALVLPGQQPMAQPQQPQQPLQAIDIQQAVAEKKVPEDPEMAAPEAATPKAPAVHARPDAADQKRRSWRRRKQAAERDVAHQEIAAVEIHTERTALEATTFGLEIALSRLNVAKLNVEPAKCRTIQGSNIEVLGHHMIAGYNLWPDASSLPLSIVRQQLNYNTKLNAEAAEMNAEAAMYKFARLKLLSEQAVAGRFGPAGSAVDCPESTVTTSANVSSAVGLTADATATAAADVSPAGRPSAPGANSTRLLLMLARERAEREQLARQGAEREQLARECAEREQLARERAEREQLAREGAEKEQLARECAESAEREQLARECAEREQLARERAEREQLAREGAEKEQLARECAEREQLARKRAEREQLAREGAEKEQLARECAAREQLARQCAEREIKKLIGLTEKFGVDTSDLQLLALHSLYLILKKKVDEKLGAKAKREKAAARKQAAERDATEQEIAAAEIHTERTALEATTVGLEIARSRLNVAKQNVQLAKLNPEAAERNAEATMHKFARLILLSEHSGAGRCGPAGATVDCPAPVTEYSSTLRCATSQDTLLRE